MTGAKFSVFGEICRLHLLHWLTSYDTLAPSYWPMTSHPWRRSTGAHRCGTLAAQKAFRRCCTKQHTESGNNWGTDTSFLMLTLLPLLRKSYYSSCSRSNLLTHSMEQSPSWEANRFSVKKFPPVYGTRSFITAFTSARHLSLSSAISIHSMPSHPTSWRSILILSSHLRLGLPSGLFPSGFPTKTLYTCTLHPTWYMPRPSLPQKKKLILQVESLVWGWRPTP